MKLGWLWDSILKTTACPSPISTTPAFSPGPWMTRGPLVGSVLSHFFELLYEQCSFHMAEKMPSSVKVGTRPIRPRILSYSSGFRPWSATSSGVISMASWSVMGEGRQSVLGRGIGRGLLFRVEPDGEDREHHEGGEEGEVVDGNGAPAIGGDVEDGVGIGAR